MNPEDRAVAEAAASLTVADFQWLEKHGALQEATPASEKTRSSHAPRAREESSQERRIGEKKAKRRHVKHEWPEVGTILETDYHGQHYEAEVIEALRYKSGKAVRILTGPAVRRTFRSMSGAMLAATEEQRRQQGLGRKGVSNGWAFWKPQ